MSVSLLAVFALLVWWLVGRHRKANDFLVATEGEMKKVNWTSRKEVIGSTKVVIASVILLAVLLFLVDWFFIWFFRLIDVLKVF